MRIEKEQEDQARGVTMGDSTDSPTAPANEAAHTGRRRCRIPEHRRQIRAMQKWCEWLQMRQGEMWQRNRADRLEHEKTCAEVYRLKAALTQNKAGWCLVGMLIGFILGALAGIR